MSKLILKSCHCWKEAGKTGTKEECTDYIKEVWTDMRPLSLRKEMDEPKKG